MADNIKGTGPDEDDFEEEPGTGHSIEEVHRRIQVNDATNLTADPLISTAWDRVKLSRHQDRPYTLDYINSMFTDFVEIHGDRRYGDDPAIVAGMAWFHGQACVVIGHQNGRSTKERQFRNFAMPKPEGYRKALRVMKFAEKFRRPVFTFIDTTGAYPGVDAEERGQAEAIAYNLREIAKLRSPVIVTVTGQGGSGGALAIGVGDKVLMLENAIYSVISPEGCASILWRDPSYAEHAAAALKLTARDLLESRLIDQIVPEPEGGAQSDHQKMAEILDSHLVEALSSVKDLTESERCARRYEKFRAMGEFIEPSAGATAR
ncbi:MAG TPA: acetyl-CoA carboxylase carboxyltransferase subunit alpha [Blastocatellia bacterium]|nr:acetyl-CoA carboxylase carboxyltransferase subunit alpha [Blastocatellia bacterium]